MDEAYKQKLSAPVHSTLLDDFKAAASNFIVKELYLHPILYFDSI